MPNPSQPAGLTDKQLREWARLIGKELSRSGAAPARHERESTGGREALEKDYGALGKTQKRLDRVYRQQELQLKRQVLQGKKSERWAQRQLSRAKVRQRELDRVIKKETEGRMASAKGFAKIAKQQENIIKHQAREAKIAQQTGLRRAASERLENLRAKALETREKARELAQQGKERARDKAQQVAGGAARQGFGAHGLGGDLAGDIVEGLVKGGDPIGVAIGFALATSIKAYNRSLETAKMGRQRFLNYGIGPSGGRAFGSQAEAKGAYRQEMAAIDSLRTVAKKASEEFITDSESVMSSMVRVATKTGESWTKVGDIGMRLAKLEYQGLGTLDELTDRFIKGRMAFGQTADQTLSEMEGIAQDARDITALTDNVMQMDDFYKAVEDVRGGIDSLTASSRGLSKMMRLQIGLAKKLDLTYEQALDSAKKLTLGLSQSYDQGFATVEVEEDLANLLADKNFQAEDKDRYERVRKIQEDLLSGRILHDMAARFLNEVAGTSTSLMVSRLGRATSGEPLAMTEQRLNVQFTYGMQEMLKEIQKGGDVAALEQELAKKVKAAQAEKTGYESRLGAVKEAEKDISRELATKIEELLNKTLQVFNNIRSTISDGLDKLTKAIDDLKKWMQSLPFFNPAPPAQGASATPTSRGAPTGRGAHMGAAPPAATPAGSNKSASNWSINAKGDMSILVTIPADASRTLNALRSAENSTTSVVG